MRIGAVLVTAVVCSQCITFSRAAEEANPAAVLEAPNVEVIGTARWRDVAWRGMV